MRNLFVHGRKIPVALMMMLSSDHWQNTDGSEKDASSVTHYPSGAPSNPLSFDGPDSRKESALHVNITRSNKFDE